jgi:hypothetical protein
MPESEGRKPEEARNREDEPVALSLTAREINLAIRVLTRAIGELRDLLALEPGEDPDDLQNIQTRQELGLAEAVHKKLHAVLESREETLQDIEWPEDREQT